MDLKTGTLYWPQVSPEPPKHEALQHDVNCDVAVVGGGLSGAMIAHSLNHVGLDVVLIDKREVGAGSTSASTALVLYEIDTPLTDLIRRRGKAAAVRSYECCREAITVLDKLVHQLDDTCQFRRRPSLYLASRRDDLAALKREFDTRKLCGFAVQFLAPADIKKWFSFTAPGAIWSTEAAEINPLQLAYRLVHAGSKNGMRVFTKTEVVDSTEERECVKVLTANGKTVKCRWLVKASGFEAHEKRVRQVVKLKSSYVMVTRPIQHHYGWHERCLIWETRRPYFYARTTTDSRIMIGGADEDFQDPRKRDRLIAMKSRQLGNKLTQLFPQIPITPQYRWAGTFGETKDGLPYIGRTKPGSKILYALCYGANGTNFAVLASNIIRDMVLQKTNRDAKLFAFDR